MTRVSRGGSGGAGRRGVLGGGREGQAGTEGRLPERDRPTQHPISKRGRRAVSGPALLSSPGLCSPGVLKEIQSTLEGDRG